MTVENVLQNVATYTKADLGYLIFASVVLNPESRILTTALKNFNRTVPNNLGDTITFRRPYQYRTQNSLVANNQAIEQLVQTLSVTNVSLTDTSFSDQNYIFNLEDYMEEIGRSRMIEMGISIERDLFTQFAAEFRVNNDQSPVNGQVVDVGSGPFRFYSNGWAIGDTVIPPYNDVTQLASSRVLFRNFGASPTNCISIIPDTVEPGIVGNALNQFVVDRNEDYGMTWKIGSQGGCRYFSTSLLPTHEAGVVGNNGEILTLTGTNENNGIITELTFSGATPNQAGAVLYADRLRFDPSTAFNFRYLAWNGKQLTVVPVDVRATADVDSDGAGNVTIPIFPALNLNATQPGQNIPFSPPVGITAGILPTHRVGCMMSGNPFYFACPQLPSQEPFPTVVVNDETYGHLSLRHYYGTVFKQNLKSDVIDTIYGSTLVPENCMAMIFPAVDPVI